jgi:predicted nucleotidyltransferase
MAALPEIERVGIEIGKHFNPERVVLFGSHARGDATPDSDVDLLVVMRHEEAKGFRMATKIRCQIRPSFPMDLLVRTPEEMANRLALGDSFLKEITEQGIVLYESAH